MNTSGSTALGPIRRPRPCIARPTSRTTRPAAAVAIRPIIDPRWTPPASRGAATTTATQRAMPASVSLPAPAVRRRRPERARRLGPSLVVNDGARAVSENAFVDDEDVTRENHHVRRTPFADVGDR